MAGNIYPTVLFDLNPKLKELLVQYAREGQIDCDSFGNPYLLQTQMAGKNHVAIVVRNGTRQSIILNTRARSQAPVLSWDPNDGYRAKPSNPQQVQTGAPDRRERQMRTEMYLNLAKSLMESN